MKRYYSYKIIRFYHDQKSERVLRTFVSKEHAKEHCSNPEASSKTCQKPANIARTEKVGRWSDVFMEA